MKRPQVTTTLGISGLTVSVTKLLSLFGDYKIYQIGEAIKSIPINEAGIAILGIAASIYGIYHDDNRGIYHNDNKDLAE